jgi:hypothetical protein
VCARRAGAALTRRRRAVCGEAAAVALIHLCWIWMVMATGASWQLRATRWMWRLWRLRKWRGTLYFIHVHPQSCV